MQHDVTTHYCTRCNKVMCQSSAGITSTRTRAFTAQRMARLQLTPTNAHLTPLVTQRGPTWSTGHLALVALAALGLAWGGYGSCGALGAGGLLDPRVDRAGGALGAGVAGGLLARGTLALADTSTILQQENDTSQPCALAWGRNGRGMSGGNRRHV
jgi:hypothetical protein